MKLLESPINRPFYKAWYLPLKQKQITKIDLNILFEFTISPIRELQKG